ncbi:MAG: A/G-specific adenine glycosylase [Candidatus Doudnabacteria bacterium]|nr:A/G-specific adenine glycosylase [Candidatus Doudnabacteria bacterium]
MSVTDKQLKSFRKIVWDYYRKRGRRTLPWRNTRDSYKIFVSELMLQQTQVQRVSPKYAEFLKLFPSVQALATAPLSEALKAWQGLGYNRRAKFLHQLAQEVVKNYRGKLPATEAELLLLPGIGKATAAAMLAFAFNKPTTYLETNVRSVFLHHFFSDRQGVDDGELLPLIARAAEDQDPRTWNWALLDYGAYIKATHGNPNKKSKHYAKQSKFEGSNRQVRGAVLRLLGDGGMKESDLVSALGLDTERVLKSVVGLLKEGLISKRRGYLRLG